MYGEFVFMHSEVDYENLTDEELMSLYALGHSNAFSVLYSRHSSKVYGFLCKKLQADGVQVDEVFQNAFLKLHNARSKYDSNYPFLPWMYTIVRNTLIDFVRKKRKQANEVPTEQEQIENLGVSDIKKEQLIESFPQLNKLPEQYKKAVTLRYEMDLPFDEIARRLDTTPGNVRKIISRALEKLRTLSRGEDHG